MNDLFDEFFFVGWTRTDWEPVTGTGRWLRSFLVRLQGVVPDIFELKELFVLFFFKIDTAVVRVGRNGMFMHGGRNKLRGTRPQPTTRLDR